MPEPPNASVPIAESHERHNVFLTSDGACDLSQSSDARRDADPTWPAAPDPAGTPTEARAPDPGRLCNRLAPARHRARPAAVPGARSAAAVAIAAVAAAMLGFALAQPDQRPPRAGEVGRPATVAPTAREPLDVPRLHGGAEAAKPKRAPAPGARSRQKPTPRPAARRTAPRRARKRARPSTPTPVPPPAPSPSLAPVPSQAPTAPAGRRTPTLPAPVPPGTPPEFM